MSERFCLDCNKPIEGRADKKFCSVYCRSSYHYIKNKDKKATLFRKINYQLKLNRRILKAYNKAGKSVIRKEILLTEGFDPRYITHYWKAKNGNLYFFCYEYGFMEIKENQKTKYVLVHSQDYMIPTSN